MFWRRTPNELITVYRPGTPNASGRYFMRDDALALAAAAGRVWSAYKTPRGHQVVLDHGPYATLYQHLEQLLIAEHRDGPGGPLVEAGHPLGVVGGDPTNAPHLKHLHFELWRGRTPIDPEPFLHAWQLVEIRTQPTGTIDVALAGEAHTTRA